MIQVQKIYDTAFFARLTLGCEAYERREIHLLALTKHWETMMELRIEGRQVNRGFGRIFVKLGKKCHINKV